MQMRRLFSGSGTLWRNSPIRNDHFSCDLCGAEHAFLEPLRTSEGVILCFRSVKCAGHSGSIFIARVCFLASSRTHSETIPILYSALHLSFIVCVHVSNVNYLLYFLWSIIMCLLPLLYVCLSMGNYFQNAEQTFMKFDVVEFTKIC